MFANFQPLGPCASRNNDITTTGWCFYFTLFDFFYYIRVFSFLIFVDIIPEV